jgi:hypothetical protein
MKKGIYLIGVILCILSSCKRDDDVYTIGSKNGVNPNTLLKITSLSSLQIEADTASLITIKLNISANADTASHTINASTSLGTFLNGKSTITLIANATGEVTTFIRSGQAGKAQLSFTVQNIKADTVVTFIPALADDLLLSADKYQGDTTVSYNLTTSLIRNAGKGIVTDPDKVWYTVAPPSIVAKTLICPAFVNTIKGTSSAVITNPYKTTGNFTIQAKTLNSSGDTLRKSITLVIK